MVLALVGMVLLLVVVGLAGRFAITGDSDSHG